MDYIILDLEWNQRYYCQRMPDTPNLKGEIIQIGAVKTDKQMNIIDTFKIFVKPNYYTKMHRKVEKLTHIKDEDLEYGFCFETALKHFRNWCGNDFVFLCWGKDDMRILCQNMNLYAVDEKWLPKTYDVQQIYDLQIAKENRQISLADALETLEEPVFTLHDALNDAKNTVSVCRHLDLEQGFEEYYEEERLQYDNDCIMIDSIATDGRNSTEICKDLNVISFCCPKCGSEIICREFIKQNAIKKISISSCENGDEYLIRLKFNKRSRGLSRVSRLVYEIDEENRKYYEKRKAIAVEKQNKYLEYMLMQ